MPLIPDGVYLISNAGSGLYMDVAGGSIEFNTPVHAWEGTKGDSQKWQLSTVNGVNEFVIKSSLGEAFVAMSLLRIWPPRIAVLPTSTPWSIEPVGDGQYRFHFTYSDGVITHPDGTQGAQLISAPWTGASNQVWHIVPV